MTMIQLPEGVQSSGHISIGGEVYRALGPNGKSGILFMPLEAHLEIVGCCYGGRGLGELSLRLLSFHEGRWAKVVWEELHRFHEDGRVYTLCRIEMEAPEAHALVRAADSAQDTYSGFWVYLSARTSKVRSGP